MDLQERLTQCRIDKKAIEAKEQELIDAVEKEKTSQKIPFARFVPVVGWGCENSRLILHLTPEFVHLVKQHKGQVVSLGRYGSESTISVQCNTNDDTTITKDVLVDQYTDVQVLID